MNTANAKAQLSDLLRAVEQGETIELKRRGKPIARLVPVEPDRKPFNWDALDKLHAAMPYQEVPAGEFVRRMRDEDRY